MSRGWSKRSRESGVKIRNPANENELSELELVERSRVQAANPFSAWRGAEWMANQRCRAWESLRAHRDAAPRENVFAIWMDDFSPPDLDDGGISASFRQFVFALTWSP